MKKTTIKGRKLSARDLRSAIVKLFRRHPKKVLNPKQVTQKLKVANSKDSVLHALTKLTETGDLELKGDFKYRLNGNRDRKRKSNKTYEGKVDMTRQGSAFILVEGLDDDIYVPIKHMNSALNGDIVKVSYYKPRGRRRPEGEVLEIVERAKELFVGTLEIKNGFALLIPDDQSMLTNISIKAEDIKGARPGEKVVVQVVNWNEGKQKSPEGIVTNVLGKSGDSDMEMKAILINNGFALEFPEAVIKESESFPEDLPQEEIDKRRDLRQITTITIDPTDAKDFDDAISIQKLEDDIYEIGVHIADVTHYVREGSALDEEALDRSTSVYLVDRVLPMLPERLSNGLCSLRPHEDKFTFSAMFWINVKTYKVIRRWFGRTVTHSDRRFTYNEAQEVIETGQGDFAEELKLLNDVAKRFRKKRFKQGSIDFDMEEVRFKLDENGKPIDVYVKERKEAHLLVEEFMLLANREVAMFIDRKAKGVEIPFVYRVHDEPDPDRVRDLALFAAELGLKLNVSTPQKIAAAYNNLAKAALKDEALKMLQPMAVRTMAKAEYTTDNIGHYGLGFQFYSHFTSPIRRYSDVLAHRILAENLDKQTHRVDKQQLEAKCQHISRQERRALDAERESIKYKQVEFIKDHVGEVFPAKVNGFLERGMFCELIHSKAEGLVTFDTFGERFTVEETRLKAVGQATKKTFKMGDEIKVRIVAADLQKRQIDMEYVDE